MSAGLHGHVEALRTGDGGAKDAAVRALVEPAGTEKYANDREEHAANRVAIVAAGGIAPLVELARGGSAGAKGQAAGALASLAHADQKVAIAEAGGIAPLNDVARGGSAGAKELAAQALRDMGIDQQQRELRAVQLYQAAADQGNARAQCKLGVAYAKGRGVAKDDACAAQLFRAAADQGHAGAQGLLGFMHWKGRGVPKDDARAAQLYQAAANQGNAHAQCNLGFMYRFGRGVAKDDARAAQLYQAAAGQGSAIAQCNLDCMYGYSCSAVASVYTALLSPRRAPP